MKTHTVGFIFDQTLSRVVLIQKNRPTWQAGKLNGIGGKIEPEEESLTCMVREAHEESGLMTAPDEWIFLGTLNEPGAIVDCYATVYAGAPEDIFTRTDEQIAWYEAKKLPDNALPNLSWLVAFAHDALQSDAKHPFVVNYTNAHP